MAGRLRRARHWLGLAAFRLLLASGHALGLPLLRRLGAGLGQVAALTSRRDRRRAVVNLARAFPEQPESWRRAVAGQCGRHLGTTLGEVAWLWSASGPAILARSELVGLDALTSLLEPRRGVILVTAHCGNWEWMNLALGASGVPMTVAAREVYDPRLDELARRLRGRFGAETVLRGEGAGQRLVQALHQGRVVGLLIDQDIDAPGAFVELFGHPAWTPTGAATLALRTGTPIVTGFATRLEDGRMRLAFTPAAHPRRTRDVQEEAPRLTAALTAHIERQIRACPAQWVWMHRRWKRRPAPGETVWRGTVGPATAGGGEERDHVEWPPGPGSAASP